MQRPLVYYSNIRAALRVLTGAKDIELNPAWTIAYVNTRDSDSVTESVCKELTPSRTIENLIPISVQNRSLIATNLYLYFVFKECSFIQVKIC